METISKFYGIFSVMDQKLICRHVVIIIMNIATIGVLLVLNVLVSISNH